MSEEQAKEIAKVIQFLAEAEALTAISELMENPLNATYNRSVADNARRELVELLTNKTVVKQKEIGKIMKGEQDYL